MAALRVEIKNMKIFLRVAFFLRAHLFLLATLSKQRKAEIWL